jgi:tripartite ATP-independent transporter DctM subunit
MRWPAARHQRTRAALAGARFTALTYQGALKTSVPMNAVLIFALLVVPDADRHADLDLARPDGAHLPVHLTEVPIESVALKLFTGIEKFEIMAIPFFILAGNFLTHGGVARRMIRFATSMVGHWYGGLGLSGVLACALFAAVSGRRRPPSSPSARSCCRRWSRQGFPARFGAGVITTSGALGILIPPSIVMVMYAVATNTSVGALFMAGVIPGIMV